MHHNLLQKSLSLLLFLPAFLPLRPLLPSLTHPSAALLLPVLDHFAAAIFATRYLTFSTGHPPTDPQNLYPLLLPQSALLHFANALWTSESVTKAILPRSGSSSESYDACQARFTIFVSTNAFLALSAVQVAYGVPRGAYHYTAIVFPALVIALREGCSLMTIAWMALLLRFGNATSLAYLIFTAVQALVKGVSLERVLLAPRGNWPDDLPEDMPAEGGALLPKGEVSDVSEKAEGDTTHVTDVAVKA